MVPQPQGQQIEKKPKGKPFSWKHWTILGSIIILCIVFVVLAIRIIEVQGIDRAANLLTIISIIFGAIASLIGWMIHIFQVSSKSPPASSLHSIKSEQVPVSLSDRSPANLALHMPDKLHIDWGEAPRSEHFHGRLKEIAELKHWIVDDQCRMIVVLGIGGIGKTSLASIVVEQIKGSFEHILWISLQNAPPLKKIILDYIKFISNQQSIDFPDEVENQFSLFIEYFRKYRCLLILDNFESIFQNYEWAGQYLSGYETYGRFLRYVGNRTHRSCLLLTSREKLKEMILLEGTNSMIRSYTLEGLNTYDGLKILKDRGFVETEEGCDALVQGYAGHPLALTLVSQFIQEVFNKDITSFLQDGAIIFSDVRDILDQQFERLSKLEQMIMYWLAVERYPLPLKDLQDNFILPVSKREIQEALWSLRRRYLVEFRGVGFLLQNVIMEYTTDRFINQVCEEIGAEAPVLLESHALIRAQARDFVRESQERLLLKIAVQRLLLHAGKQEIERKLKNILSVLSRMRFQYPGYAAGNILNLLVCLQLNLSDYDLSHLMIRQAYLQGIVLQEVNFSYSHLGACVFTDIFGCIPALATESSKTLLATGTTNGEVFIWQFPTGRLLFVYPGHIDWVRSVAFSPDSTLLASSSDDRTIRLWEVSTGHCTQILRGHTSRVLSVSFTNNGRVLASGSDDGTVRLWEVSTGHCFNVYQDHTDEVKSVVFNPDGTLLASGSSDQTLRLWEVATGRCQAVLHGHTGRIWSVAFSPDGTLLASGSSDQTLRLWEVETGNCLRTLQGHTDWIWSVAFSPDGTLLASGSSDQTLRLWEVETGNSLSVLQGHTSWIRSIAFGLDGTVLVSGGDDQTIRLWNVSSSHCLNVLQGHTNWVRSIAFSPDDHIIASGGEDHVIRLWEVSTGRCLTVLRGHINRIRSIAFHPDRNILASGGDDQTVRLWEGKSGQCLMVLRGHAYSVKSVAFSPDGGMLASGGDDRTIHLWKINTGQSLGVLHGHTLCIWSVTFSPDGTMLASGSDDGTIRLWEVSTGQCLHILRGHLHEVKSVVFSPDGSVLASGSEDQTIRLWEVNTGQCFNTCHGHTQCVRSVTFSPDGSVLASGSEDQTIRLWGANTGQCFNTCHGHTHWIWSVTFGSTNRIFASGSNDGTIKLWDVQSGMCTKTLSAEKPYERMNITGVTGLTKAQITTLKLLGAIEDQ